MQKIIQMIKEKWLFILIALIAVIILITILIKGVTRKTYNESIAESQEILYSTEKEETFPLSEMTSETEQNSVSEIVENEETEIEELEGNPVILYAQTLLNIRQEPNTSSAIIGTLKTNDEIEGYGNLDDEWIKVKYKEQIAYIYGNLLSTSEVEQQSVTASENVKENEEVDGKDEVQELQVQENGRNVLNVNNIMMIPELPSGCEVTSLTIVLNYMGYPADKCVLSDSYLDKGPIGETDIRKAFVGEPREDYAFGCDSPVIVNCADKYLAQLGAPERAYDISGTAFDDLYHEIDAGHPIIIWGTEQLKAPGKTVVWNIDGNDVVWKNGEHCMVLYGYDEAEDIVYVADPLAGNMIYDRELFQTRYEEMFSQAVILK